MGRYDNRVCLPRDHVLVTAASPKSIPRIPVERLVTPILQRFRSSLHGEGADLCAADFYFYAVGRTGIVSLHDGAAH